jgi:hypothetical protein
MVVQLMKKKPVLGTELNTLLVPQFGPPPLLQS